ncbi:AraC family transcriptional regulator [Paraburkholderia sp. SARCC-3016]|jgi:AraC-like DNA-binding protein|uniref:AraC family transcriptional regulator n=1 Tax=Paraburkholderia sp. SARCC-3016 TaxID=3058611 RepID=UPI0028065D85|nr:AraC family transcriptional regulator [Paraburkholderia sp. SARCC-3016]MDQ7979537.1 AraC family transcriptional regulator [Paraburkholderia sp. SARCC-3016]
MNFARQEIRTEAALRTGEWSLGDLHVTTLDAVDLSECRLSSLPGQMLRLFFVRSGSITLTSIAGSHRLDAGSLFVAPPQAGWKRQNFYNQTKLVLISIPRRALHERGFQIKSFELVAANMSNPDARAVGQLILSIAEQSGCTSLALRARQGRHLLDLLAMVLGNPLAVISARNREVALSRAKDYVARHLEDHELSATRIATSVGISPGHLNRLFKASAMSVMRYVWACRLDRAADLLRSRGESNVSISDIAFSCGFASHAHFSRVFKARFGFSPRDYLLRVRAHKSGAHLEIAAKTEDV